MMADIPAFDPSQPFEDASVPAFDPTKPFTPDNGSSGALGNSSDDSWLSSAAKGAGSAIIKGLGNSVGTVGNLGNFADYLLARADSAITGRNTDDILADYAARRKAHAEGSVLGSTSEALDPSKVMPSGEDVYAPVLKRTGEYKPDTEVGNMAQSGLEMATGAVGPGGGAAALERGAVNAAPRVGMQALKTAQTMAPANFAAGAIGQGVSDATGDPLAGLAAGVAIPGLAGGVTNGIRRTASNITRPFAEDLPMIGGRFSGTRDQMVGERLRAEAENPEAFEHALFPGPLRPGDDEIIPASQPTTGQLTGDMGILQAERRARTEDNTPFNQRDAEQNAARQATLRGLAPNADTMLPSQVLQQHLSDIEQATNAAVGRIQNGAQELAGRLGPGTPPETIGATIRDAVENTRREAASARRALYSAVDPEGKLALVAAPVRDAADEITKGIDPYTAPLTPDETRLIGRAQTLPDVMPFKSLLALDQDITSSMAAERRAAGQSPSWNRLQQLKGAVQGAINDAVDNQAAYQAHAVARGEMAPEHALEAFLNGWRDNWYTQRAGANDATGTLGNAGAGSAPIFGARRTTSQTGREYGSPPGSEGVSEAAPILTPNFDQAAAARLAAAKQGHAAYARLYKEGPVGQALKTMGFGDNYMVPNSGLPSRVIVRGDKGYQTAQTFLKAAKNSPEAVAAMRDHAVAPLRQSLNPDGTINANKFNAWKKNYAGALRALDEVTPGFSNRFDNAARASDVLTEAGARAKQQVDNFQKSEAGKFLKLTHPVEVENHVGSMLSDRLKGPTQMRSLLGKLRSDPSAIEGLRKAGIDWMTRKFATTAEAGTSGEKVLSSAGFRNFIKDNRPTLSVLYPDQQVNMFWRIAEDLDRANRSVTATAIKGSPGTAKDALPFLKRSVEEAKRHTSILGAALAGSLVGFETAGLKGALTGAGLGGTAYLLGSLRAAGIHKTEDMFRDALLNPERARYYLSKVNPDQIDRSGTAHALSRSLRRELMMAPTLITAGPNKR